MITYIRGAPGLQAQSTLGAWLRGTYNSVAMVALLMVVYIVLSAVAMTYSPIQIGGVQGQPG